MILKKEFKGGKIKKNDVENARKDAAILINHLIDYGQRCDLIAVDKSRMQLVYKNGTEKAELIITNAGAFLVRGSTINKIQSNSNKLESTTIEEFEAAVSNSSIVVL